MQPGEIEQISLNQIVAYLEEEDEPDVLTFADQRALDRYMAKNAHRR